MMFTYMSSAYHLPQFSVMKTGLRVIDTPSAPSRARQ